MRNKSQYLEEMKNAADRARFCFGVDCSHWFRSLEEKIISSNISSNEERATVYGLVERERVTA